MIKVLLINPPDTEQGDYSNPPLGLLYLAGTLIKHNINTELVDGYLAGWKGVRQKITDFQPDIVGITCLTPDRQQSFKVAKLIKKINQNIIVVLGGAHATIMHKQIIENYPEVDIVVRGEGENVLLQIAKEQILNPKFQILKKKLRKVDGITYRNNCGDVIVNKPQKQIDNLDKIPFPAWHLVDLSKYPPSGIGVKNGIDLAATPRVMVIFSRGCTGKCNFCSTWWIWQKWRCRSSVNMVDELKLLNCQYNVKHFFFADDCMTINRKKIIELCNEIIRRKLNISFEIVTRTDSVDKIMLQKLKTAGCYGVHFGVETGSAKLLKLMGKDNTVGNAKKAIELVKKTGMEATALMIVGNIGETINTINQSIGLLKATDPDHIAMVGGLWVLPGTRVYNQLKAENKINDSFWLTNKPYMIYEGNFTKQQLRYITIKMQSKREIETLPRGIYWQLLQIIFFFEELVKHNKTTKRLVIRYYGFFDKIIKLITNE